MPEKVPICFPDPPSPCLLLMKEAGVLISYKSFVFTEDTENRRQFIMMNQMLPISNYFIRKISTLISNHDWSYASITC